MKHLYSDVYCNDHVKTTTLSSHALLQQDPECLVMASDSPRRPSRCAGGVVVRAQAAT